ncbi:MAG TPA: SRPBCC domain-containing protein [Opitutaceae bacterium]
MASKSPAAQSELLIRCSAVDVYNAFVSPRQLARFWLAKASGPLVVGKKVRWHFPVPGVSDTVTARVLEPGRRIVVEWGSDGTETEWTFEALSPKQTHVRVTQTVKGTAAERAAGAINGTEGYTLVLSDLKVLLERGIRAGIVKDKAALIVRQMRAQK